jgi:predicted nucleic acid-binding protein
MITLADTSALIALLDRSDAHHDWAVACLRQLRPPLLTCDAVLAEAWHLLGAAPPSRHTLAALHADGLLESSFPFEAHAPRVWQLLGKYADVPMGFADGCLVRMSELHPDCQVWTADRDFRAYRRFDRKIIPLLEPP